MAMFDTSRIGNVAAMLGPILMAKGMNMPALASLGPAMVQARRQRQSEEQRAAEAERELALKEGEAERKRAFTESVIGMFGGAPGGMMGGTSGAGLDPAAAMSAASAAGAGPGPTNEAAALMNMPPAGMMGGMMGSGAPMAGGGMFADLTPQERQIAAAMAQNDPMEALKFAGGRLDEPAAPASTAAMREAEAIGLTPGSPGYVDYLRERTLKPGVQVNMGPTGVDYGEPPKDMSWARDAEGNVALEADPATGFMRPVAVPIAGGPVEQERAAEAEAEAARQEQRQKYADVVTQDIDRVLEMVEEGSFPITGPIGKVASYVPGTPAYDAAQLVETVRANVGFDRLQEMRAASPTGGALGQVSNFENRLMQATLGSLEQAQTKEQFTRALRRVREVYEEIVNPPISDLSDEQLWLITDPKSLSLENLEEYTKRMEAILNE